MKEVCKCLLNFDQNFKTILELQQCMNICDISAVRPKLHLTLNAYIIEFYFMYIIINIKIAEAKPPNNVLKRSVSQPS